MYIVEKERLLGYTIGNPNENGFVRMSVLSVDVTKGGDPLLLHRTTLATDYREATKEDEERFLYKLGT